MKPIDFILLTSVLVGCFATSAARTEDEPGLIRIVSPIEGTVVLPGDEVRVQVEADASVSNVVVFGDMINVVEGMDHVIIAPNDNVPRDLVIKAGGVVNGRPVLAESVSVNVEPHPATTGISEIWVGEGFHPFGANLETLEFAYLGQETELKVVGRGTTTSPMALEESENLAVESSERSIVSVVAGARLRAVGQGTSAITLQYGGAARTEIMAFVRDAGVGDLCLPDGIDQRDVNELTDNIQRQSKMVLEMDARDLNGDGVLDIRDVDALLDICEENCRLPKSVQPSVVDIKPGRAQNRVPARGQFRVGLLDPGVPVEEIGQVTFGPKQAMPRGRAQVRDVNQNGQTDIIYAFRAEETGLGPADTGACLTAQTFDRLLTGCDTVEVVNGSLRDGDEEEGREVEDRDED